MIRNRPFPVLVTVNMKYPCEECTWKITTWIGDNGEFEVVDITLVDFAIYSELADRLVAINGDVLDQLQDDLADKLFSPDTLNYEKIYDAVMHAGVGEVCVRL